VTTTTQVPTRTRTTLSPVHHKVDRRDGERRSGMDRRDHEMTVGEVEARLATSFQTR